jgi:hypothetical protein
LSDNPFDLRPYIEGKDPDDLLDYLAQSGAQPGSAVHMAITVALQVRIAQMQHDTGRAAVRWAQVQGVATAVATMIALAALAIALL